MLPETLPELGNKASIDVSRVKIDINGKFECAGNRKPFLVHNISKHDVQINTLLLAKVRALD